MGFDWKVTVVDIVWTESNALLICCSACESICGMQSMLLLSWRCAERNLSLQSSLGALWEFWGFTGESWRRGPGQVRGHWLFHPSLTLGWQLERRNILRHQNSWQLGFHRMPWSRDRGSCSLYGPDGGRCCLFCVV